MHYIGMDCHISSLDFAVVNETGRLVKATCVATSVNNFMEFVRKVAPPRVVYMEEGTLAAWAMEVCTRFGEKLVVTNPKENHWIGSSGQKDDSTDALKLAQLARGGYIKEVHHPVGQRRRFRELMIAYHDTVRSTTRIKNKIKARFRQNGISCTGTTVYLKNHREDWREKLPQDVTLLLIAKNLWNQLDQSEQSEKELLKAARAQAKNYPEISNFETVPGIGFISAATISAILETPYRFANKRKVWMYAGLGLMKRSSAGKIYTEKLSTDYNRLLKYTIKQAAGAAVQRSDNPFRQKYLDMTLIRGTAPNLARLTIARDMLATIWVMWKKGEKYNPEIREKAVHK
ncbi:IS110 family transposase [Chloroflexota bacterium]